MRISLIAAISQEGVLGRDGQLPWHLPADLARFKALTMGHFLLLGRKTFAAIGRPLPGRRMVVISRGQPSVPPDVLLAGSLDEALALAAEAGREEVFVAGGGEIYRLALPRAHRVYLTRVAASVPGDVHFPPFPVAGWERVEREEHAADPRHAYPYAFEVYEQRGRGADVAG